MNSNYIVVTPCKNEEANLPHLAQSIIKNTIHPVLWVIYNDGSTDSTGDVISNLEGSHAWIKGLEGAISKRDLGFHYSDIVEYAIRYAINKCDNNNIDFEYIGLIDADMILDLDFFEKMLIRFENNPKIGICSGTVAYLNNGIKVLEKGRSNHPLGGLRMWSKKCYYDTGGFPKSYSADSVSNVSAMLHGWETKKYDDVVGVQTRRTSSAEGLWKGYGVKGTSDYFRDYHPIYVLFKFLKYSLSYPFYTGVAYLSGYINGIACVKNKLDNPEIRSYYRNKHIEVMRYYFEKFKNS
ncbi:glycosyltransferase family 2 protein [Methanococcoides burtonii]|uniref:Glycosyltransferase, family 2 n=1 Tax=Methanococcoides burtonii (strain DSM 6242 / NBRC 107633 / OCM 468 / ACE-M) TaxID=259564 RepID=Q12XY9_METBU|nr:glycosyltransferase [Methanococcoides burtonii]ABE51687.1 glycosyltransferase, family 2 [Methanococcoides burtonii DSM 6242]